MEFDCPKCNRNLTIGEWPFPCNGSGDHTPHGGLKITNYHTSERTTVYRNPRTGQVAYPPRADQAMDPKFVAQGYVREEIATPQQRDEFEKSTGKLHVRSHFDSGSAGLDQVLEPPMPSPPKMDKELRRSIISDLNSTVITKSS